VTRPCAFALGITLGCLIAPATQILAARYAGRHYLDVQLKETP
jgi:hypothetical protein